MQNLLVFFLFLLVLITQADYAHGQPNNIALVDGPQLALAEIDVELQCYLQNSTVQVDRTVWWKDGDIIFTFSRNAKKPFEDARASIQGGSSALIVDKVLSDSHRLYLKYVTTKSTSGKYQCGLQAGNSMTMSKPHVLAVKEVFDQFPRMIGFPTAAHANETIFGACSVRLKTKYSHLAQNTLLTFAVNGIPIEESDQISQTNTVTQRHGRTIVTETLNMTLAASDFNNMPTRRRQVRLTCIATVKNYGNYPHVSAIIYDADHIVISLPSQLENNEESSGPDLPLPTFDEIDARNQHSVAPEAGESLEENPIDYIQRIYSELQTQTSVMKNRRDIEKDQRDVDKDRRDIENDRRDIEKDRRDIEQKSFALAKEEFEWAKNVTPHKSW